jgi:hypothetical protein
MAVADRLDFACEFRAEKFAVFLQAAQRFLEPFQVHGRDLARRTAPIFARRRHVGSNIVLRFTPAEQKTLGKPLGGVGQCMPRFFHLARQETIVECEAAIVLEHPQRLSAAVQIRIDDAGRG